MNLETAYAEMIAAFARSRSSYFELEYDSVGKLRMRYLAAYGAMADWGEDGDTFGDAQHHIGELPAFTAVINILRELADRFAAPGWSDAPGALITLSLPIGSGVGEPCLKVLAYNRSEPKILCRVDGDLVHVQPKFRKRTDEEEAPLLKRIWDVWFTHAPQDAQVAVDALGWAIPPGWSKIDGWLAIDRKSAEIAGVSSLSGAFVDSFYPLRDHWRPRSDAHWAHSLQMYLEWVPRIKAPHINGVPDHYQGWGAVVSLKGNLDPIEMLLHAFDPSVFPKESEK